MMPVGENMDYTGDLFSIGDRFGTKKPGAELPVLYMMRFGTHGFQNVPKHSSHRTLRAWEAVRLT